MKRTTRWIRRATRRSSGYSTSHLDMGAVFNIMSWALIVLLIIAGIGDICN